ncbi:hypothetical protein BD324DRAFT_678523 [Kockovaella imperatae]|uniref:Zn(2)-C6 fungal-type domain-containing protein n=1 Tax=Kockovaella imperatae TaxID=4999 RepID=A0A1Y1USZ2_9TREE|nr:hypothetical protein BD324DRAFT_678523 [Kockovaella imperatae]ORX41139.1 hypothetical protein BD324DRAFT_678523 [Kockovaella imperatae]
MKHEKYELEDLCSSFHVSEGFGTQSEGFGTQSTLQANVMTDTPYTQVTEPQGVNFSPSEAPCMPDWFLRAGPYEVHPMRNWKSTGGYNATASSQNFDDLVWVAPEGTLQCPTGASTSGFTYAEYQSKRGACLSCRTSKAKCSFSQGTKVCERCNTRNISCTPVQPQKRGRPKKKLASGVVLAPKPGPGEVLPDSCARHGESPETGDSFCESMFSMAGSETLDNPDFDFQRFRDLLNDELSLMREEEPISVYQSDPSLDSGYQPQNW